MDQGGKVYFDVSFTRAQPATVGISRTVRRLFGELGRQNWSPIPVAFHSRGFRVVEAPQKVQAGVARPDNRLFNLVTGRFFRRIVALALHAPWALLSQLWGVASTRIFNGMTGENQPVAFRSGDLLLMCDASWNYQAWVPIRRARESGAKVVLLVYDLIPLSHPQFCYRLTTLIFERWLAKMLPSADAVICISKATQDEVNAWLDSRALPHRPPVGHFHLGADVGSDPDETVRLRTFFSGDAPAFVTVGSIEPRKNHVQLLDVFERLWADGSPARWLVIGRPTIDSEELVLRLRNHPEHGNRLVTLFDGSDGEIRYAYSRCKALVFPSLAEGFGLPLVEARACGSRVVASDLAVFREFADEGVRFFKAGSVDALEGALRAEMQYPVDAKVPQAKLLSWSGSGEQFVHVTRRLLGK